MNRINPIIILIVLVCISAGPCFSQAHKYDPTEIQQYLSLTGTVHCLSLFVDTDQDSWEEEEIDYFYEELQKSQEWLVSEAEAWNNELEFDNDYFFQDNLSVVYLSEVPRRKNPRKVLNTIFTKMRYDGIEDFLSQNDFDIQSQKVKVLVFVKSQNRSHAYNYWSAYDVDMAFIYANTSFGMYTKHPVISHEILHQFGAWDLYYERGKTQPLESAKLAYDNYPHSIMINIKKDIANLEVDEVTASRVGWIPRKEEYEIYNPELNREKLLEERKRSDDGFELRLKLRKDKEEKN